MPAGSVLPARRVSNQRYGFPALRSAAIGLARVLSLTLSTAHAAPLRIRGHGAVDEPEVEGASLWVLYVASAVLVLSGGAFAGLTIALMGQDGIYLQVMAGDPSEPQQKNAKRVHDLLTRGKHWVLVTLLLANVIVNETLPVVLDRCLGGGVAAVVGSTFLIVIFGEVLPQSICVRYGLQIGGYMSQPVLIMMYILAPIAWPTAKLLDWLLGEDHGTVYKKSGLKTLVTLHKNLGEVSERLNQDEVTIISAVLDLKEKPVASVMTPMEDVFVMSEDTVLDERTMDIILSAGYSRIPIHETGNPTNFVGMLLVKILITYDPEDCKLVSDFPLATLPETRPETSCLDIVNFFQEGKSHMVLVSTNPGEDHGALGVVTLEDVIEELIGEEIIDESDVYIDVHKAIRRLAPAPKVRIERRASEPAGVNGASDAGDAPKCDHNNTLLMVTTTSNNSPMLSTSPKTATLMMRRSSAGHDGQLIETTVPVRANFQDIKDHLKHLGPSNPATNPNKTRSTTVKVKPGSGGHSSNPRAASAGEAAAEGVQDEEHDETTSLLKRQISTKDGVQALRQAYGSISSGFTPPTDRISTLRLEPDDQVDKSTQTSDHIGRSDKTSDRESGSPARQSKPPSPRLKQESRPSSSRGSSISATSAKSDSTSAQQRPLVRTGSITENIIESRGLRKIVLETTSSNEEEESNTPASSPELSRFLGRATFSLFGRDKENGKENGKDKGTGDGKGEEEALLSPELADEDGPASDAEAVSNGTSEKGRAGSPGVNGNGAEAKRKRKKRKGGSP
ncbi:hypothetical protein VTH06DRAFT_7145 [Thermothelomyces fergusii]